MRAKLKDLLDFDAERLPTDDPADFMYPVLMFVGARGEPGEEQFQVIVCSPEWLAAQVRRKGKIYDGRHHLVVDVASFDRQRVRDWLATRVGEFTGETWHEVAQQVGRLGRWEYEDYEP